MLLALASTRRQILSLVALGLAVAGLVVSGTAWAQEDASHVHGGGNPEGPTVTRDAEVNARMYQQLKNHYMSPYCPGVTLGSCGSHDAGLLRQELKRWIDEGYSEAAITEYMVSAYGDEILGAPPFRGGAIVVWVAPIALLLLGLGGVVLYLKSQSRARATAHREAEAAPASVPDLAVGMDDRVEREVEARFR